MATETASPEPSSDAEAPPPLPEGPPAGAAEAVAGEAPVEEEIRPQLSFFQQPWVQTVLPFVTSLAFHIGIIGVGLATYKAVESVVQVVQEQIIIPDATIVEGAEVGGIPNPGLGGDPTRAAAQDQYEAESVSEGWSDKPSQSLTSSLMTSGGEQTGDSVIGVGPGTGIARRGTGKGIGSGGSEGGGGPLAPFGVPGGGGGIGPKSPFMGISGNARKVMYVCDASGSMVNKFDLLKSEIRRSIDLLRPIQAFNVIFFQNEAAAAVDKQQLVMANPANKLKAYEFLNNFTLGPNSDPIVGLKLAFQQKPQLLYLLTDGEFPNNDEVLKLIRERNADKSVKINTILFLGSSEELETFEGLTELMKQIATENGGVFKAISTQDL